MPGGPWTSLVVRKNLEKFGHFSAFSPTDRRQIWQDICPASVFAETAGADCWSSKGEERGGKESRQGRGKERRNRIEGRGKGKREHGSRLLTGRERGGETGKMERKEQ